MATLTVARVGVVGEAAPAVPSTLTITRVGVVGDVPVTRTATLTITGVAIPGVTASSVATLTLTRVLINAEKDSPTGITRVVGDEWEVAEDPNPEDFAVAGLYGDTAQTAEQVTWTFTAVSLIGASAVITWGPSVAAGASHSGAAARGYLMWAGAAAGRLG